MKCKYCDKKIGFFQKKVNGFHFECAKSTGKYFDLLIGSIFSDKEKEYIHSITPTGIIGFATAIYIKSIVVAENFKKDDPNMLWKPFWEEYVITVLVECRHITRRMMNGENINFDSAPDIDIKRVAREILEVKEHIMGL